MSKDSNNVQGAISDLASLRPNWTLLADTIPADFLRQVKAEIESLAAERDGHLETVRETFRVLESRGQAPDDNAPLSVTVRRVLDYLDKVTAERDALAAQLAALKKPAALKKRVEADLPAEVERLRDALAEIWDNTREFEIRVLAGNALSGAEVQK